MGTGTSGFFHGTSGDRSPSGLGVSNRIFEDAQDEAIPNKLPPNIAQIRHIFSDRSGHLPDTEENRQILLDLSNDPNAKLGIDIRGNTWYAKMTEDGKQLWVSTRNGIIQNGGINIIPIDWDTETGLCARVPKNKEQK